MWKVALVLILTAPVSALAEKKRDPNNFGGRTTAEECRAADWLAVGRYDGKRGRPQPQQFVVIARTCEGHGIKPHQDEYFRGYTEGYEANRR